MLASMLSVVLSSSWTPLPPTGASGLSALRSHGDTVIACGVGGCASSGDGAATWTRPVDYAIPAYEGISNLAGSRLAIAEDGQVVLSQDRGSSWTDWHDGIPTNFHVEAIALRGDRAFAVASKIRRSPGNTYFTDTCAWFLRDATDPSWRFLDQAVSYRPSGIAVGHGGTLWRTLVRAVAGSQNERIETSSDGETWALFRDRTTLTPIDDATFLALPESGDSTHVSLDSGRTWRTRPGMLRSWDILDGASRSGSVWKNLADGATRSIDATPLGTIRAWTRASRRLFAYGDSGLFSSADSGATWTRADTRFPLGLSPALRWHEGALINVPHRNRFQSITRSIDDGKTWTTMLSGLGGIERLEACPDGLMGTTRQGTILVRSGTATETTTGVLPNEIACDASRTWGILPGRTTGGDSLGSWTGSAWIPDGSRLLGDAIELAAVPGGLFVKVYDEEANTMRLDFLPDGADTTTPTRLEAPVKWIAGSPRGAWVAALGGLYLCPGPASCTRIPLPGTNSLWSFVSVVVQGRNVLVSGAPVSQDERMLFRQARLFVSADAGETWSVLAPPGLVRDAAITPTSIVANLYGAGLWRLDSETLRLSRPSARSAIGSGSSLHARGRTLWLREIAPGARLRVADASGRLLLDARPVVHDGQASVVVPQTGTGLLMATLEDQGRTLSLRWMAEGR